MKHSQTQNNIIQFPQKFVVNEESTLDQVIDRVKSMISQRFSAKVSFYSVTVPDEKNDGSTYKLDILDEMCPVRHILITPEQPLEKEDIRQIKQLIVDLFVPAARLHYQNSLLDRYESHIRSAELSSMSTVNTIPTSTETPNYDWDLPHISLPFHALSLESTSVDRLFKFSNEVHEVSGNFAMLPWSDIRSRIQSADDLAELTQCTVYISDISTLSIDETAIVWDYIKNYHSGPLLLIGIAGPLNEVAEDLNFNPGFIADVAKHKLAVDRLPLHNLDVRDLMEMFLN